MPPTDVQLARLYDQYGGLIYRDLLLRSEDEAFATELLPAVFARASSTWDRWGGGGTRLLWLTDLSVIECGVRALSPGTEFDSDQWLLERSVAGDLSKPEHRRLRNRLDEESELAVRLDALRVLDREFDGRFDWAELEPKVQAKLASWLEAGAAEQGQRDTEQRRYWRAMWIGGVCALVATLALVAINPEGEPSIFVDRGATSVTGPVSLWPEASPDRGEGASAGLLQAYVFAQGRAKGLKSGAVVAAGTRIQFRVTSDEMYLAMLGVDSSGLITTYVPARGDVSLPWTPGPAQPLGTALEIGPTRGDEVFLAFLSGEPLEVPRLRAALEARVVGKENFLPALLALGTDPEDLAAQIALVHLVKP